MRLPRRTFLKLTACSAALPAALRFAWAQTYPVRPVHIVVGFPAGFTPDIIARLMGSLRLSRKWEGDRGGYPWATARCVSGYRRVAVPCDAETFAIVFSSRSPARSDR